MSKKDGLITLIGEVASDENNSQMIDLEVHQTPLIKEISPEIDPLMVKTNDSIFSTKTLYATIEFIKRGVQFLAKSIISKIINIKPNVMMQAIEEPKSIEEN